MRYVVPKSYNLQNNHIITEISFPVTEVIAPFSILQKHFAYSFIISCYLLYSWLGFYMPNSLLE